MQRLFIIYNPRSSRYADVQREVLSPARKLKGYTIGKYQVATTNLDDNIEQFSKLLKDGDLVVAAGGDATGAIASNAILKSGKDARLAVLPYGNFNDLARTLGTDDFQSVITKSLSPQTNFSKFYPLAIFVDGKFFRYATCYVTIGMTAEAVGIYDSPKMRTKLKKHLGRHIGSYTSLASWYFKHRHHHTFIPEFKLNGAPQPPRTSDYAAVNGRSMARVMRGGEDFLSSTTFRSETDHLINFWRLFKLMTRSIFYRIPGNITTGDIIEFTKPATVTLQAEGESRTFHDTKKIEIRKVDQCLKVMMN